MLFSAFTFTAISAASLEVFSIKTYTYLGPTVEAHVKVTPIPSGCTTVVTGTWTDPEGGQVTRNSIASGTRRRAEFPIYSTLTGTFVFTVDKINCGESYSYNGNDSVSVTIGGDGTGDEGCTTDCVSVRSIRMIERAHVVKAVIKVVNEDGSSVQGATVDATWDTPNGSTEVSGTTNSRGKLRFSTPKDSSGVYTLTISDVTSAGLTYDPNEVSNSITV